MKKLIIIMIVVLLLTGCSLLEEAPKTKHTETTAITPKQTESTTTESSVEKNTINIDIPAESSADETATEKKQTVEGVTVSFEYNSMPTHASNQMAIWVEDESGSLVKTIFVTDFTAARRGYLNREDALSHWVDIAKPDSISDSSIDAISSATPAEGKLSYTWNLTDESGERVLDGKYKICLEATLFWSSNVLYSAEIDTASSESGNLKITEKRSEPENEQNADMIDNVNIYLSVK